MDFYEWLSLVGFGSAHLGLLAGVFHRLGAVESCGRLMRERLAQLEMAVRGK